MVEANIINVLYWFVSLLFETIIIIAYALLSGLILKSAVNAVFSSLIFYIASRIVGFFVYALQENLNRDFLENIVNYTSIVIPRLDFFAKTEWLLNGNFDHLWLIQALIYIPFLLILGIIDFNKKQF